MGLVGIVEYGYGEPVSQVLAVNPYLLALESDEEKKEMNSKDS